MTREHTKYQSTDDITLKNTLFQIREIGWKTVTLLSYFDHLGNMTRALDKNVSIKVHNLKPENFINI